jgi:tRNA-specific 2-thiouridylase
MNIIVGLSGGVDSAVTAHLLQQEGHNVVGVHMSVWSPSHPQPAPGSPQSHAKEACYCPGDTSDQEDAATIADRFKIPFHILDVSAEYATNVLDYFASEYASGRTPNPCVACNQKIKFGALLREVEKAGIPFDMFATGHYARVSLEGDRYILRRAKDLRKDQTYFIYRLSQEQLSRCLFPLGNYEKGEIKQIARDLGLAVADKPESQNFVNGDYGYLLKEADIIGPFILEDGTVLGQHRGIAHYTIGQRRGLGIAWTEPLFVVRIEAANHTVVLGTGESLYGHTLTARDCVWSGIAAPTESFHCSAKIRYASPDVDVEVTPISETSFSAAFHSPQKAITPGQSIVLYDGDKVLGGGIIA